MTTYKDLMVLSKLKSGQEMPKVELIKLFTQSASTLEQRLFRLEYSGMISKDKREGRVYYKSTQKGLDTYNQWASD